MKLFINADIEGCTGVVLACETRKNETAYREFAGQMTREVMAAYKAAHEARADGIVIKGSHRDATNIDPFYMPNYVTLVRGKSGHPYNMISGLDDSFDGVIYIGYHASAGSPGFAINHTSTGDSLCIRLNGNCMNELILGSYTAASYGVLVLFLSGDRTICDMAKEMVPAITMAMAKTGLEASTYCKAPGQVEEPIRQGIEKVMAGSLSLCRVALPETFTYETICKDWKKAYQMSSYPGMRAVGTLTNRLETSRWMDVVTVHCFVVYQSVKEIIAIDIEMFRKIPDTLGPSGSKRGVVRTAAGYCGRYQVEDDAMDSLYVHMPDVTEDRPVMRLDAHLDKCGFMVQCIHDNGYLGILMLGGFHLTSLPAHTVIMKTRADKKIRGIIMSKSVHFMDDKERASLELCIEGLYVDIGAANRWKVEEDFDVSIRDPMVPEVSFSYNGRHGLCFDKAFDDRVGCACIADTMNKIYDDRNELTVGVVGASAAQEEVNMRDATITTQVMKSDLTILFEGSSSDDFFFSVTQAQRRMKNGIQIHRMDKNYVSNPMFMEYVMELTGKFGVRHQEAVRRGNSTDADRINPIRKTVPVSVLDVSSRYVHSHYNFYAKDDLETTTELAAQVIRGLDPERIRHILRQGML